MQEVNRLQGKWRTGVFLLMALLVVALDQLSKAWIRSNLDIGESLFEIGLFGIIRVPPNTGAAFGLFQGYSFALTVIALVGVAVLLVFRFFIYPRLPLLDNILNSVAFGLILGGTVGNLIDRVNPNLGGVTDFISIGIWPAFNLADSAIVVGAIILAYSLLSLVRVGKQ